MAGRILAVLVLLALTVPASAAGVKTVYGGEVGVLDVFAMGGLIYVFPYGDTYVALSPREEPRTCAFDRSALVNDAAGYSAVVSVFPCDDGARAVVYDYEMVEDQPAYAGARLFEVNFAADGTAALGDAVAFDWDGETYNGDMVAIAQPVAMGDALAFLYRVRGGWALALAELETGGCEKLEPALTALGLCAYRDEKLLVAQAVGDGSTRLMAFDPATRETENLCVVPGEEMMELANIAYDASADKIYYTLSGTLYAMDGAATGTAERIGTIPVDGWDNGNAVVAGGAYALCADGFTVYARSVEPDAAPAIRLTVSAHNSAEAADAARRFLEVRSDVEVTLDTSYADVLTAVLTQSSETDVYLLDVSSNAYAALYERGYLADLSGRETLTGLVGGMYGSIRDAVTKDGALVAVPVSFYASTLAANLEAMEAVGLSEADVPETWPAFLELLARLPGYVEDTDYAAFPSYMAAEDWRQLVLSAMVSDYLRLRGGAPDEAELIGLLKAFDAVDFDALGSFSGESGGLPDPHALFDLFYMFSLEMYASYDPHPRVMPLAFEAGETPALNMVLTVAVVNPYSENPDAAVAFLEELAAGYSETFLAEICPGRDEPVRDPNYEDEVARQAEELEAARAALAEASGTDVAAWEARIAALEEGMDQYEATTSWVAGPEAIAWYRSYGDLICVETNYGIGEDNDFAFSGEIMRYADGRMSAEDFAAGVVKRFEMARLEGM